LENASDNFSLYEFLKSFVFLVGKIGALSKANINPVYLLFEFSHSLAQGVSKKAQHKDFNHCCFEIPLYDKNHQCKYLYDKIYTIGYYFGCYSSMRDQI
jgi:hypothetical protein